MAKSINLKILIWEGNPAEDLAAFILEHNELLERIAIRNCDFNAVRFVLALDPVKLKCLQLKTITTCTDGDVYRNLMSFIERCSNINTFSFQANDNRDELLTSAILGRLADKPLTTYDAVGSYAEFERICRLFPNVKSLNVMFPLACEKDVSCLTNMHNLNTINFSLNLLPPTRHELSVFEEVLRNIGPNLRSVIYCKLNSCASIFELLAKYAVNMRTLTAGVWRDNCGEKAWSNISKMKQLRRLDLREVEITEEYMKLLLDGCDKLAYFKCYNTVKKPPLPQNLWQLLAEFANKHPKRKIKANITPKIVHGTLPANLVDCG